MSVVKCRAHTTTNKILLLKFHPAIIKWHSVRRQRRTISIAIFLHSIKCSRQIVKMWKVFLSIVWTYVAVCVCVETVNKSCPCDVGMGLFPPSIEIENLCSWFCIWHRVIRIHALGFFILMKMNRNGGNSCRERPMWHFIKFPFRCNVKEWKIIFAWRMLCSSR